MRYNILTDHTFDKAVFLATFSYLDLSLTELEPNLYLVEQKIESEQDFISFLGVVEVTEQKSRLSFHKISLSEL